MIRFYLLYLLYLRYKRLAHLPFMVHNKWHTHQSSQTGRTQTSAHVPYKALLPLPITTLNTTDWSNNAR